MKKLLLAALLASFSGVALAQTSGSTTTTTTTTFQPAWRSEIKEYVVKEKKTHIPPPAG